MSERANETQPKVISVIIPVYKVERYLKECVASVMCQTYPHLEIILVDDGSPDNSGRMCDELALTDSRIKVVHKTNGGLSSARNAGLEVSTGEYIAFLDSDDYVAPQMYERLLLEFAEPGVHIAESSAIKVNNAGEQLDASDSYRNTKERRLVSGEAHLYEMLVKETVWPTAWNKLYAREVIGDTRFIHGILNEDVPFNFALEKKFEQKGQTLRHAIIPDIHYYYRVTSGTITTSRDSAITIQQYENMKAIAQDDYFKTRPQFRSSLLHKSKFMLLLANSKILMSKKLTAQYHEKYIAELRKHKLSEFTAGRTGRAYWQIYLYVLLLQKFPKLYAIVKGAK